MIILEPADAEQWTVTFLLEVEDAGQASVVGTFNDWDPSSTPFTFDDELGKPLARIDVAPGTVLRFRYLSDTLGWLDDDSSHERWMNEHGTHDNVVFVPVEVPSEEAETASDVPS